MAKDQLLCLVNKLKKADKNQDGTITLPEWEDWVQRTQAGPKILIKNDKVNKVLNPPFIEGTGAVNFLI